MKLYLSSFKFGDNPTQLADLTGENKEVAVIMNAADPYGPAKRPQYLASELDSLYRLGLKGHELDLRHYFGNVSGLAQSLGSVGLIWAMGGNAFVLRRAMKLSGFDHIVPDLVRQNKVVYGGFSAGAVVAGSSLRGIDLVDNPDVQVEGYDNAPAWDGMNLVPWVLVPHYKSDHPESQAIDSTVAYLNREHIAYKTLSDGDVLMVNT